MYKIKHIPTNLYYKPGTGLSIVGWISILQKSVFLFGG